MSVTTTSLRQGKFETRFWHKIFEEEVGRVKGHFGPVNTYVFHILYPHFFSFHFMNISRLTFFFVRVGLRYIPRVHVTPREVKTVSCGYITMTRVISVRSRTATSRLRTKRRQILRTSPPLLLLLPFLFPLRVIEPHVAFLPCTQCRLWKNLAL